MTTPVGSLNYVQNVDSNTAMQHFYIVLSINPLPSPSARYVSVPADNQRRTFIRLCCCCVEQSRAWFTQRHCSVTVLISQSQQDISVVGNTFSALEVVRQCRTI